MKQQGLDFREALVLLAEKAGVPLEGSLGADGRPAPESPEALALKRLRALNEAAGSWFHFQLLQAPEAQYARSYLISRGVSNESIAHWRLGYAPDGDALARYLQEQGYTARELIDAGLAREREREGARESIYDYFRNRLIFPIRNARGQTIAFGGRELGGGHPKYLNTPQTPLFDKSATLYGLDLARDGIRRAERVVIVEGYMDALVTHQYGFRNVVACIGSAITEKHIRQIKKLTRRVTLALDPDAAGESATLRGITVAQQAFDRVVVPVPGLANDDVGPGGGGRWRTEPRGMVRFEEQVDAEITVARLPAHEDPDEFVRRDSAGWQRAIDESVPLVDYLIEAQTADLALDTPQGKLEGRRRLLPIIAEVHDRTLASDYADRVAMKLRLDVKDIQLDVERERRRLAREQRRPRAQQMTSGEGDGENVEHVDGKYQSSQRGGPGAGYSTTVQGIQGGPTGGIAGEVQTEQAQGEYCLGVLLVCPWTWPEVSAVVEEGDFITTETRALYGALALALRASATIDPDEFVAELPEVLQPVAALARERALPDLPLEGNGAARIASQAAYRLKRMRLKAEMAELDALQREAERAGDADALRALLVRRMGLLSQRRAVDAASAVFG